MSYSTHFPTMMYHTVHGALVASNYASVGGAPEAYGSCRVCVLVSVSFREIVVSHISAIDEN